MFAGSILYIRAFYRLRCTFCEFIVIKVRVRLIGLGLGTRVRG